MEKMEEEGIAKEVKEDEIEEEEWIRVENGWKERESGKIHGIFDIRCLYCRYNSRSWDYEGCIQCENNRCQRCKDLNLSIKCSECCKLVIIKCIERQKKLQPQPQPQP